LQMFELFSGFLKYFPGVHRQIVKKQQELLDYIAHSVEKHKATLDPSAPRDYIDTYLLRMEKVNPAWMREGMGESDE
jgi:cytochrome P450 family 2 subfamily B